MFPKTCPVCKHDTLEYGDKTVHCTNCTVYSKDLPLYVRPITWALGKSGWWWRAIIVCWFVVMLVQNWADPQFALNRLANPFSALDLGIHEIGHFVFIPLGEFMTIAGGSLFQCLFPLFWVAGFIQIRYYFGAALCFCWLGLNMFDVASYADDARARLLPLVGPGSFVSDGSDASYDAGHDWYQLLSRTGHLNADHSIATLLRIGGTVAFFVGIALAATLIVCIAIGSSRRKAAQSTEDLQPHA
ncbi:MAG TPA: hypothetical protein VLE73_00700 [Candidatus Saccharimonadales bacterium]|nr:hypothetical protein [Candidatus Saccharimonadales bacterium]